MKIFIFWLATDWTSLDNAISTFPAVHELKDLLYWESTQSLSTSLFFLLFHRTETFTPTSFSIHVSKITTTLALDKKDTVVIPEMKFLICQTIQVPQNPKIPSYACCNLYPEIIISVLTKFTTRNKHKETKLKQDKRSKITSGSLHQNQNVGLNLEINQKPAQLMKQRLKNIKGASRSVLCRLQTL